MAEAGGHRQHSERGSVRLLRAWAGRDAVPASRQQRPSDPALPLCPARPPPPRPRQVHSVCDAADRACHGAVQARERARVHCAGRPHRQRAQEPGSGAAEGAGACHSKPLPVPRRCRLRGSDIARLQRDLGHPQDLPRRRVPTALYPLQGRLLRNTQRLHSQRGAERHAGRRSQRDELAAGPPGRLRRRPAARTARAGPQQRTVRRHRFRRPPCHRGRNHQYRTNPRVDCRGAEREP
mmetsp:Transcript_33996/g.68030  ORF Transcript_33996/g.68030 Transcript_33996/m.68030 type:complete len:237 (+) Transcript_33996:301-1011(+)